MTLKELENKLIRNGVPKDAYSLSGGLPNEAYCIEESNGKWLVYYSERGSGTGKQCFNIEQEACDYSFRWATG